MALAINGFGGRGGGGFGDLTGIFKQLQGAQTLSPLQQAAIDVQTTTRKDVERLFDEQSVGFDENVTAAFQKQQVQETGKLAERGVSEQTLALLGDFGGGREGGLALEQLQEALVGGKLEAQTGFASNIADIFTGASRSNTGLLSQLLSSVGNLGRGGSSAAGAANSGKLTSAGINQDLRRRLGANSLRTI